jgi:hypothetical protein
LCKYYSDIQFLNHRKQTVFLLQRSTACCLGKLSDYFRNHTHGARKTQDIWTSKHLYT